MSEWRNEIEALKWPADRRQYARDQRELTGADIASPQAARADRQKAAFDAPDRDIPHDPLAVEKRMRQRIGERFALGMRYGRD